MAVALTVVSPVDAKSAGLQVTRWTLTTADPIGDAVNIGKRSDKSVHVYGTFGGATASLKGGNDADQGSPNNQKLRDFGGALLDFTAADLRSVSEATYRIFPELTVVGAGATVQVYLFSLEGD